MSAKKFARVLLPLAVFLALAWSLATPAPAYALLTPQIVSVNPGSGSQVGSNVCIRARIEQDFDYRAMRIRFGNEGWQEGTELEFERCFDTRNLSPGWYEIRVEADRLGGNWSNITSATQSYELTAQPQPTQPPPPPKGPAVEFTLTPSGGADIGTKVTIEVWVDSTNPGAIRITVPCGGVPVEHTTPHFKTTWDTEGCGEGTETVRVCARDVNDPNWANQTCAERQYILSSPPIGAPTADFWADSTNIQKGQCTWLHWTTTNASVVDIDGDVVAASGEMQVCPTITKYYSLKAQGDGGVATRSLSVMVSVQATSPPTNVPASATPKPNPTATSPAQKVPTPTQEAALGVEETQGNQTCEVGAKAYLNWHWGLEHWFVLEIPKTVHEPYEIYFRGNLVPNTDSGVRHDGFQGETETTFKLGISTKYALQRIFYGILSDSNWRIKYPCE